jgi:Phosphoglycerol transferase and related proteins, alkaline phosphatase superfamily
MDNVVRQIYDALEHTPHQVNTLFVLAGDHGMTKNGNHGGDTASEIASALLFISPNFMSRGKSLPSPLAYNANYEYYSVVNQVDVVPTLATLLGFSIPGGSVGVYIKELLALFPGLDQQVRIMMINAHQMMNLFVSKHKWATIDLGTCNSRCVCSSDNVRRVLCLWERLNTGHLRKAKQSMGSSMEEVVQLIREVSLSSIQNNRLIS